MIQHLIDGEVLIEEKKKKKGYKPHSHMNSQFRFEESLHDNEVSK